MRQPDEPGLNETAIAHTGPNQLLAISRTDNALDTFGRFSEDMGLSWGPLISYGSQVGSLQLPQLSRAKGAWVLFGREALAVPGVQPGLSDPRQLVAFISYDHGKSFRDGMVLETYVGFSVDGAYAWSLPLPEDRLFVVYYAATQQLHQPDIRSLVLRLVKPQEREIGALHLATQLAAAHASHALNFAGSRYSLNFRFRSQASPAGSQFALSLGAAGGGAETDAVRWELPSTHATDPSSQSGFIADGKFVPVLTSFTFGQSYRIRTIVDETRGTQEGQVLDSFGNVVNSIPAQPLAEGTAVHPSRITIGNDSTVRSTDTQLDFVFIRPVAAVEPAVSLERLR